MKNITFVIILISKRKFNASPLKSLYSLTVQSRFQRSLAILFPFHFVTKNNTMIYGMFHNVFKCLDIKISFLFSSEILSTNNNDEKIEIPKGVQDKNTASFMRNA